VNQFRDYGGQIWFRNVTWGGSIVNSNSGPTGSEGGSTKTSAIFESRPELDVAVNTAVPSYYWLAYRMIGIAMRTKRITSEDWLERRDDGVFFRRRKTDGG
jgi:hypothetical protein